MGHLRRELWTSCEKKHVYYSVIEVAGLNEVFAFEQPFQNAEKSKAEKLTRKSDTTSANTYFLLGDEEQQRSVGV